MKTNTNYQTQEFRLQHEDTLVELARNRGLETLYEVRELLRNYMLELEEQAELVHDSFLQDLIYDGLQEIDVTFVEDSMCDLLEISLDTY